MAGATKTAKALKTASYRYEATNRQGKLIKGTLKATNEIDAERLLVRQGYNPVSVEVAPSMFSLEEAFPTFFKVKPQDIMLFSRQLATLLKAGISLLPGMEVIHDQATSGRAFRKILGTIIDDLRTGGSFSQSIDKHPEVFTEVYRRTITVGEQSGNLETVLNQMAAYLEKEGVLAKKIAGALAYPMIIMGVGLVVGVILMVFVMPQLLGMFTTMDIELPLPTRILMGTTDFITNYTLYLLIGGVLMVALVLWLVKQPTGRRLLDRVRLTAPLIGAPILLGELSRFSRSMSMLISAGLSLQEIMELVPQASSNMVIRDAFKRVGEGLNLGEGLAGPMSHEDIFPALFVQMASVGEQSNTLDITMGVVADFYEVTAEDKMNAMVGVLGPLSTVVIALFVGFIAISVLMPIYSLTGAFG